MNWRIKKLKEKILRKEWLKKWFKILYSSNFPASNINSKKHFLQQWVFKCAICYYQSTLVTVTFIDRMFYCSQSEISFHIITVESYFGVCIAHLVIHTIYIQSSLEFHRIYSVLFTYSPMFILLILSYLWNSKNYNKFVCCHTPKQEFLKEFIENKKCVHHKVRPSI